MTQVSNYNLIYLYTASGAKCNNLHNVVVIQPLCLTVTNSNKYVTDAARQTACLNRLSQTEQP